MQSSAGVFARKPCGVPGEDRCCRAGQQLQFLQAARVTGPNEWSDGPSACAWETEGGRTCYRCHDAEGAHFPNLVVAEVRNQEVPRREQRQAMRAAEASVRSRGIHVACLARACATRGVTCERGRCTGGRRRSTHLHASSLPGQTSRGRLSFGSRGSPCRPRRLPADGARAQRAAASASGGAHFLVLPDLPGGCFFPTQVGLRCAAPAHLWCCAAPRGTRCTWLMLSVSSAIPRGPQNCALSPAALTSLRRRPL